MGYGHCRSCFFGYSFVLTWSRLETGSVVVLRSIEWDPDTYRPSSLNTLPYSNLLLPGHVGVIRFFLQSLIHLKRLPFAVSDPPLRSNKSVLSQVCLKISRPPSMFGNPTFQYSAYARHCPLLQRAPWIFLLNTHILDWIPDRDAIWEPLLDLQDTLPQRFSCLVSS